ncbi:hypothetical protein J6W91_00190 [Candidatus Saccharibacteria bacterium]|nr:hypothetical protein [Candidatus Saccharibacteria bacterium]
MDDKTIIENLKKFIHELKNRVNLALFISIIISSAVLIGLIVALVNRKDPVVNDETPTETEYIDYSNPEPDADADGSITTRRFNDAIKKDMQDFIVQMTEYKSNHNGKIPVDEDAWRDFYNDYLKKLTNEFKYENCDFAKGNCPKIDGLTWKDNQMQMIVATHAACYDGAVIESNNSRHFALYLHLKGETNGTYCISG